MSEIPFVNQLGDAIETAITRPAPARRRIRLPRRRWLAVALAALVVAGGGAAIAGMLHDPVEIGFGSVACFEGTEPDGNVAVIADPTTSPENLCATSMRETYGGLEERDLIACSWQHHGIVVVVRGDRGSCRARGLAPVPASYRFGRRRAARLQAVAKDFEQKVGCLAPREFARGLTAELRARGWGGWRALAAGGRGPCGRVSVPSGAELLGGIGSAVDATARTIAVKGRASLHVELVVYGPDSPGVRLFDSSGGRCFTMAGLERHARSVLAPAGVPIRFRHGSLPHDQGIADETGRRERYADGCAIYVGAYPAFPEGRTVVVAELWQR